LVTKEKEKKFAGAVKQKKMRKVHCVGREEKGIG